MNLLTITFLLGITAAIANAFGGAIIIHKSWERRYLRYFIALGSGFMLAVALVEMAPESWRRNPEQAPLFILAGYFLVHFFEHTLAQHFHFGEETHEHEFVHSHRTYSVLLGLMIHTFFDGIAIASGFIVSARLGWLIFFAVFLHKIPEGFTVASVMLAAGRSRAAAWGASGLLGAATFLGVVTMVLLQGSVSVGLPLAAGVTLYVAASDLIPEVNQEPGMRMALLVFVGVAVFLVLDHFFQI
ncbi:MAG: ZIP family magnesium transporter [Acidobacteria bacterium]|nr:MAG: ZIP family magnesium transporter [Acidobacteriota bacterium]